MTDPLRFAVDPPSEVEAELVALLRKMAAGDEAALTTLYARLNRRIYAFALRRLSDSDLAEEVVVETLYEAWRHASRFEGRSKVSTWVLGIAHHKALDKLRSRGAREWEEIGDEAEQIADPGPDTYSRIAQRQQGEQIRDCMEALPDAQREALSLVFYEDMALGEVAEVQSCPENTVKTRLFHARRKMRECLERQTRRADLS
jgi:RNA polymerase sigma-70 factor (ECF subfamily)